MPVLDRYTGRPPVRETRAREKALSRLGGDESWEAARKRSGQKPVPTQKRAAALARQLAARHRYRAVDRAVEEELSRSGSGLTYVARKLALWYGRVVWRAMESTEGYDCRLPTGGPGAGRKKRGRPRKTRAERLLEAEARMRERAGDVLPVAAMRRVSVRVRRLYGETRG